MRTGRSSCDANGDIAFQKVDEIVSFHHDALTQFYRNEIDDTAMACITEDAREKLVSLGSDVVRAALEHQRVYCRKRGREHRLHVNNVLRKCARVTGVSLGKDVEVSRRKKDETVWHKGRKQIAEEIIEAICQRSFHLPSAPCGVVHKRGRLSHQEATSTLPSVEH
jgi:hypothetical protein